MKAIKLLTLTSRNYLAIFLVLTLFFFGVFYLVIQDEVLKSTNEILYNRKVHILEEFKKDSTGIPGEVYRYSDFVLTHSTTVGGPDRYSDTLIYESVDQEVDEYRKLTSAFEWQGRFYRLEIVVARLETHEIAESIFRSLVVVFILIAFVFYFSTRYFSRRLWRPFYRTLQQLNNFEVDQTRALDLSTSRIEEFEALNKSIVDLTERTRTTFLDQKQFIENASHEMQTPLAITQSKLELLIEDPHLTEAQSEIVQTLINSTQRLARLNKTLLLLSKIENQQFLEKESVSLKSLIDEILLNFEEQQESMKIQLDLQTEPNTTLYANRTLVDLTLTNLIKNAFSHNMPSGSVQIKLENESFSIANTSLGEAIPPGNLFHRFYKQSTNKDSWGLGLAMVKKICDISGWKITYSKTDALHQFIVTF